MKKSESNASKSTKKPTQQNRERTSMEKHLERMRAKNGSDKGGPSKPKSKEKPKQNSAPKVKTAKNINNGEEEQGTNLDQQEASFSFGRLFTILDSEKLTSKIFSRLELQDKKAARLVCKRWNLLVDPLLEWDVFLTDVNSGKFVKFIHSGKFPRTLEIASLMDFKYVEEFSKLGPGSLEKISFSSGNGISGSNLAAILKDWKGVENMEFDGRAFPGAEDSKSFGFVRNLKFLELKELSIYSFNTALRGQAICAELLSASFPALTSATIIVNYNMEEIVAIPPLYVAVYNFVASVKGTLRNLSVSQSGAVVKSENPYKLSNFNAILSVSQTAFESVAASLEGSSLTYFVFKASLYEGMGRLRLGLRLMDVQFHLTIFELMGVHRSNLEVWTGAQALMTRNAPTLMRILIGGCICPPTEQDSLNLQFFSSPITFPRLVDLQLSLCGLKLLPESFRALPSSLRALDLGPDLVESELKAALAVLPALEKLTLLQRNSKYYARIPKVSLGMFKATIKGGRSLKWIVLLRETCDWAGIYELIRNSGRGLVAFENTESSIGRPHVGVNIQRERLPANFFD